MKYILTFTFLFTIGNFVFGQDIQGDISWLNNDDLEYDMLLKAASIDDSLKEMTPSMFFVELELTEEQLSVVKSISNNKWLDLLTNESTDFAANLTLHYLFEKDAISLYRIKREDWLIAEKEKDIDYWKNYLQNIEKQKIKEE